MRQMVTDLVAEIAPLDGVTTRAGISAGDLALLEDRLQLHLPAAYRELLLHTNGLEVRYGATRILGSGPGAPVDLEWFDHPGTWKFAYRWWRDDLDDFAFFAFNVQGALTGCRRADLQAGSTDPLFFTVHPLSRTIKGGSGTVSVMFSGGVRSMARNPRQDLEVNRILDHFGEIPADRVLMPPATGWLATDEESDEDEELEASMLLPVADALIGQADLFRHGRELRPGDQVRGLDTWTDQQGRTRLRYRVTRPGR